MAQFIHSDVLDAALLVLKTTANQQVLCSQVPLSFNQAVGIAGLAKVAMTPANFTLADGDVSGRKIVVSAKSGVLPIATGTVTHLALVDTIAGKLLFVLPLASFDLTVGAPVDLGRWQDELRAPLVTSSPTLTTSNTLASEHVPFAAVSGGAAVYAGLVLADATLDTLFPRLDNLGV